MRAGCCPQWLRGWADPKPGRCPWWWQQGRASSHGAGSSVLAPQHPDRGRLARGKPEAVCSCGQLV